LRMPITRTKRSIRCRTHCTGHGPRTCTRLGAWYGSRGREGGWDWDGMMS
jgi:hypothetical protein